MQPGSAKRKPGHRLVRIHYAVRAGAFAYSFLVLGLYGREHGFGALFWGLLAAQFLIYPHLAFLRASRAAHPRHAEHQNFCIDAVTFGAWSGGLGFPVWVAYSALAATSLNGVVARGLPGLFFTVGAFGVGAAVATAFTGAELHPATNPAVTALCFFGSLAYACAVGLVVKTQTRRLSQARHELRESEDRYRLIAENAAELIGMVDADSRWLYASPSYARLLDRADLEEGADAFRRAHPDDGDLARVAVRRTAATGTPRELALRLVDREGRVRQLRARLRGVTPAGAPASVILVCNDVTDVREGEERLLLAAHALEGMTEAIMITAADGTVVTVNQAFSRLTGVPREQALGRPEAQLRNALQPPAFYDDLYIAVNREGYWSDTVWCRRANGSVYREWHSVRAVRDDERRVTHYVHVFCEVNGRGRGEADEKIKA